MITTPPVFCAYELDLVVIAGWLFFIYLMLALFFPLHADLRILVYVGPCSVVDAGLSSLLGCLAISWPPFRHVVHVEVLVISVKVGYWLYWGGVCEY